MIYIYIIYYIIYIYLHDMCTHILYNDTYIHLCIYVSLYNIQFVYIYWIPLRTALITVEDP